MPSSYKEYDPSFSVNKDVDPNEGLEIDSIQLRQQKLGMGSPENSGDKCARRCRRRSP